MSNFFHTKPVFARVSFTYNGVHYLPGDLFSAPKHKVQQLWFARKLTHDGVAAVDDAPLVTLEHKGAGWYNVLMSGAQMNTEKIKGKEAAMLWAMANLGVTVDAIEV